MERLRNGGVPPDPVFLIPETDCTGARGGASCFLLTTKALSKKKAGAMLPAHRVGVRAGGLTKKLKRCRPLETSRCRTASPTRTTVRSSLKNRPRPGYDLLTGDRQCRSKRTEYTLLWSRALTRSVICSQRRWLTRCALCTAKRCSIRSACTLSETGQVFRAAHRSLSAPFKRWKRSSISRRLVGAPGATSNQMDRRGSPVSAS